MLDWAEGAPLDIFRGAPASVARGRVGEEKGGTRDGLWAFRYCATLSIHAWTTPARTSSGLRARCCVALGRGGDGIERETEHCHILSRSHLLVFLQNRRPRPLEMLNRPMIFAVLALTFVVAATATAATGLAKQLLEMEGSLPAPHTEGPPPAASNSTLSLPGRALAAGADACTGQSVNLPAVECSAWLDLYDGTGGTGSGVLNATVSVIEQCACPVSSD